MVVVVGMLVVETTGQVRELAKTDLDYKKLMDRISKALIRKYWLDDGLVYVSGGQLYITTCRLRQKVMDESQDMDIRGEIGCIH